MVFTLCYHPNARTDLAELRRRQPAAAAAIAALLEQAAADQDMLDSFTVHDFGAHGQADYHVARLAEQQGAGRDRNLWRIKIWGLEDQRLHYRIVYALDPRISRYTVLGIVPREFNYDESHPLTQRIVAAYDDLGIPTYR